MVNLQYLLTAGEEELDIEDTVEDFAQSVGCCKNR